MDFCLQIKVISQPVTARLWQKLFIFCLKICCWTWLFYIYKKFLIPHFSESRSGSARIRLWDATLIRIRIEPNADLGSGSEWWRIQIHITVFFITAAIPVALAKKAQWFLKNLTYRGTVFWEYFSLSVLYLLLKVKFVSFLKVFCVSVVPH